MPNWIIFLPPTAARCAGQRKRRLGAKPVQHLGWALHRMALCPGAKPPLGRGLERLGGLCSGTPENWSWRTAALHRLAAASVQAASRGPCWAEIQDGLAAAQVNLAEDGPWQRVVPGGPLSHCSGQADATLAPGGHPGASSSLPSRRVAPLPAVSLAPRLGQEFPLRWANSMLHPSRPKSPLTSDRPGLAEPRLGRAAWCARPFRGASRGFGGSLGWAHPGQAGRDCIASAQYFGTARSQCCGMQLRRVGVSKNPAAASCGCPDFITLWAECCLFECCSATSEIYASTRHERAM